MRWLLTFVFVLFTGLAQAGNDPFAVKKPDFLPVDQAFAFSTETLPSGQTRLYWQITDGYYLYQKRLKLDGLDAAQRPALPTGEHHSDEFFGDQQVYRRELELLIPAGATGKVSVGWQGCADAGLCYPPQSQVVDLGGKAPVSTAPGQAQAQDQSLAANLQHNTLGWSLLAFFGLGLLLAFTPCMLPMLPLLAGVVLALPMFGFFELQLPAALRDRLENAGSGRRGGSLVGAGILGALSGLLVGPCMTAPLAGALLYIAKSGKIVEGGLVLFTMGIGMGLPLLLLVTVGNRFLPKPGAWMDRVKAVFGFLFLGIAVLMIRPVVSESLWLGLWGALLLIIACSCIWQQTRQPGPTALLSTCAGVLLGLWGSLLVVGAAGGSTELWRPLHVYTGAAAANGATAAHDAFITLNDPAALQRELDTAKARGQWVLVDYYADWCVSCKIMEKTVFSNAEVQAALGDVRLVRLDVTNDNP